MVGSSSDHFLFGIYQPIGAAREAGRSPFSQG